MNWSWGGCGMTDENKQENFRVLEEVGCIKTKSEGRMYHAVEAVYFNVVNILSLFFLFYFLLN
jgi:hypothetical protein